MLPACLREHQLSESSAAVSEQAATSQAVVLR
jgi:hypothetical protein